MTHVLIVEDDRSVRETLSMVLEASGFAVEASADGNQTLAQLQKRWPDILLLDLTLQEMSGEELYRLIGERFGRVPPTLVLSAVQEGADRTRNLPGAYFLAKPYTIDQLVSMIREVVIQRKAG